MASSRRKPGQQNHRVSLMKRSTAVSATGEAIDSFTSIGSAWASMHPRTAREIDVGGAFVVEEDALEFRFRYGTDIAQMTAEDVIDYRGERYEITGNPKDIDGRRRELIVPARLMKPSTNVAS